MFFIKFLSKFSKSVDRSVAGGRKVYFADTGVLNVIGDASEAQLLENAVVNQLDHYGDLSFYNKKNISEIDIILDKKIGFEVKMTGTERDKERVAKIGETINLKKTFVVSKNFKEDLKDIIYPQFL